MGTGGCCKGLGWPLSVRYVCQVDHIYVDRVLTGVSNCSCMYGYNRSRKTAGKDIGDANGAGAVRTFPDM